MVNIQDNIANLPQIKELMQVLDLSARKSLGQHFLLDLNLTSRIARAGKPFAENIFEIGPGPGGLTRALLMEGAENLIAIEKDKRVITFLDHLKIASADRLTLIEADALNMPLWDMDTGKTKKGKRQIIANLPYNIATALLLKWLAHIDAFSSMILMFQREVAMRLTACHGTAQYGRLSIITQWLCDAEILFDIPPEAFTPPPKIISSVVRLTPKEKRANSIQQKALEQVTAIGFGQRRKMLRASFKYYGGAELLEAAEIDPSARPQDIDIDGFVRLADIFSKRYGLDNS